MSPSDGRRRRPRSRGVAVVLALLAVVAVSCEPQVTGQVLVAGDFTITESAQWVTQSVSVGPTGLLPTVNAVESSGVRDSAYWTGRFDALEAANGGFDVVVLGLGMNDVLDGDRTTNLANRVTTIVDAAGDGGGRPVLWATLSEVSPGRVAGAVAFNNALRSVAATRPNLRLIEFGAELLAHPDYLAPDGVHWSEAGQRAFGDLVAAALESVPLDASISVTHHADVESVVAGRSIRYEVAIANTGSVTLHDILVAAPGAPGCSGPTADLLPGASRTIECTYTTTTADVGTHASTVTVTTDETATATSNRVDVEVRAPAAVISGTVRAADASTPVGGTWVAALRSGDFSVAAGAVASANGDYAISLGAGTYFLYVIDPSGALRAGFFGAPTAVEVAPGATVDADPVLASARGSVTGVVTGSPGGAPLSGIWALALAGSGATGEPEAIGLTDGSGRFTLPGLPPGNHFVGFVDPSGAHATRFHPDSGSVPGATAVPVSAGAAAQVDASLPSQVATGGGTAITGRVTEAGTGRALAGARVVALRSSDFAMVRGAVADAEGAYSLDLVPGTYLLAVFDPTGRHRMEWYDGQPPSGLAAATAVVAPGTADVALDATTGVIDGTITDEDTSSPVAGAWVVAVGPSGISGGAVTRADGSYAIEGLAPGTYRVVILDPDGGRQLEYHDDAEDYATAAPIAVNASGRTTIDAALARPRPNFVVILTDDQTLESMRVMPRVNTLLAEQGTTFSQAFNTFPLCCPARATLLTGQYAHNHHVVNNIAVRVAPNDPIGGSGALDHSNTLATWLHDGGYQTAHVGKYLNCWGNDSTNCRAGAPSVPPGWDDWFGLIDPYPASYGYFEFDVLDNDQIRRIGPAADVYQTDVLADRAVADVHRMAASDRPFYLNLWPQAPHAGGGSTAPSSLSPAPAPRHTGLFTAEQPPSSPSVGETDVSDKPSYIRCGIGLTAGAPAAPGCGAAPTSTWTSAGLAATYRASLQSLQAVDEMVGEVVQALDQTGELDNTIIVYTSDNGFLFGEHRLNFRKVVPYEESVHVPLVIRGPGFPAGHVAEQIVGNIDLAPTITSLAGVEARRVMDGRSLVPLAGDPAVAARRAILLEDWPVGSFVGIPPHYDGVRTQRDVYLEYANGEREYYDLDADPFQLTSRHADPLTATRRQTLASLLAQLKGCAGASCEVTAPP